MTKKNIEMINEKDINIVMSNHIFFPETVIMGDLFNYIKTISNLKCFLIISRIIYSNIGEKIKGRIPINEESIFMFDGEPTFEIFESCNALIEKGDYEYILAIGGGSVMDLAKAIKNKIDMPLVIVPTTPATGSETTPYSVLIDSKNKRKTVINSKKILPDVVILDASLMSTISKKQLGYSIMDILGHSIEALVSRKSSSLSDSFALESIRLIFENYEKLKEPYNKQTLEKILSAGFFGGLAQNMAAVGLIHAFAHNIGPRYNIKHSKAISIFIIPIIRLNMSKCEKYDKLNALGDVNKENILEGLLKIKSFFEIDGEKIEVKVDINKDEEINLIKKDICAITNPIRATDEELRKILEECIEVKD